MVSVAVVFLMFFSLSCASASSSCISDLRAEEEEKLDFAMFRYFALFLSPPSIIK